MVEPIFDFQFRLILIGDSTVGKSSLLKYFTDGKFSDECDPTVGVDFYARLIEVKQGVRVKLQLWDTAGQERFRYTVFTILHNCVALYLTKMMKTAILNNLFKMASPSVSDAACYFCNKHKSESKNPCIQLVRQSVIMLIILKNNLGTCFVVFMKFIHKIVWGQCMSCLQFEGKSRSFGILYITNTPKYNFI
jgi:GTPase SAR1 family protein